MLMRNFLIVFLFGACLALFPETGNADEYSSTNFVVKDPGITSGGGEISSTNFRLQGAIGQVLIGTSSASNFQLCIGVFCFPAPTPVSTPTPTPTPSIISGAAGGGIIESILRLFGFPVIPRPSLTLPVRPVDCPYPPTDLNCDGIIGVQDLSILLYLFPQGDPNPADFNRDRAVNTFDFSILFSDWNERLLTFAPESQSRLVVREASMPGGRPSFAFIGEHLVQPPTIFADEEASEDESQTSSGFGRRIISLLRNGLGVISWIFDAVGRIFRSIWGG